MPNKKFLEEYPLYRKFPLELGNEYIRDFPKPAIHMFCEKCSSEQTFNMTNDYDEVDYSSTSYAKGRTFRLKYECSSCNNFLRFFLIGFDEEAIDERTNQFYAIKIGQFPSWRTKPDKNFTRFLGKYAEYYEKGLTCESQSYGIGAYAYYRRITEAIINELLSSVSDLVEGDDKQKYEESLEEVKKTKVTEEKIKIVKEMLPQSLRPEGLNPLAILHDALSAGLHGKSDEDCMKQAEIIRGVLTYLVSEITRKRAETKKFTKGMRKLLDKKTNNKKAKR